MHLYLDMDGVLMNFEGHVSQWLPIWRGRIYHHLPRDQWTQEESDNDDRYHEAMADPLFWCSMRPMADAYLLWSFCRTMTPYVLTATPANVAYHDRCARDKLNTLHHHFDSTFPQERFHAVKRADKARFAMGPHCVLVDDMEANCREWVAAGGTAILHTSAIDTIRKLEEILHV